MLLYKESKGVGCEVGSFALRIYWLVLNMEADGGIEGFRGEALDKYACYYKTREHKNKRTGCIFKTEEHKNKRVGCIFKTGEHKNKRVGCRQLGYMRT